MASEIESAGSLASRIASMADIVRTAGGARIPFMDEDDVRMLIESDRAAIALAAKREVLAEIATLVGEMQCNEGHEFEVANQRAVAMVATKYAEPASDPKPEGG